MRKNILLFSFLLLLLAAAFLLAPDTEETLVNTMPPAPVAQVATLDDGEEVATLEETSADTLENIFEVLRVVDGDTIEVDTDGAKDIVRYIGINTPETVDPRRPLQCFGHEASARNRELVEGKVVRLVRDISDRDKYGRLLRYVYVGGVFVNLELVREGYARASTYPPDVAHQSEFVAAEREAREAKRGLWSVCR